MYKYILDLLFFHMRFMPTSIFRKILDISKNIFWLQLNNEYLLSLLLMTQ